MLQCVKCGCKLNDGDLFCSNCGENIPVQNKRKSKNNIFLGTKMMLIMFLLNYVLYIISLADNSSIIKFILSFLFCGILGLVINPFLLVAIVLSILNTIKPKLGYVISCLILCFFIPIPVVFINLFLQIENQGLFTSKVLSLIYLIQTILLVLVCLFRLIFKQKNMK